MIYGMKLAHRKKRLKRMKIRIAVLQNDHMGYQKENSEYRRMLKMPKYLRSEVKVIGIASDMADELNSLTRIAADDEKYVKAIQMLSEQIEYLEKRRGNEKSA